MEENAGAKVPATSRISCLETERTNNIYEYRKKRNEYGDK